MSGSHPKPPGDINKAITPIRCDRLYEAAQTSIIIIVHGDLSPPRGSPHCDWAKALAAMAELMASARKLSSLHSVS